MRSTIRARLHDDRGTLGGADILFFGVVVIIFSSLVILNVWLAIDTSFAVSAAAREGARAAVESPDADAAAMRATEVMREVMTQYGRDTPASLNPQIEMPNGFERCEPVTATVSYEVDLISVPFFGDLTSHTITAQHTEIVDPFRSGTFEGGCGG